MAGKGIIDRLFAEGYAFDFFQAVRLFERLNPNRQPVGGSATPANEAVRFRSHLSLSFPPSAIYDALPPGQPGGLPQLVITFLGLLGTTGALPRHYTEIVMRHEREMRGKEAGALRAWFDLFNHRLVSLFYRAWKKYRFWLPIEQGDQVRKEPDPFTRGLFSLVGMGMRSMRHRLRVGSQEATESGPHERVWAKVEDFGLLYYSGLLSQQHRTAIGLEQMLSDYLRLPVQVEQFQGQWLQLDESNRSHLGELGLNNELGTNVVVGQRVWDVQGRIRVQIGPLTNRQFEVFMPDDSAVPEGKAFYQLSHLIRLYVGPEFEIDVQLLLQPAEVPECRLPESSGDGARLGWNTWLSSQSFGADVGDAIFQCEQRIRL